VTTTARQPSTSCCGVLDRELACLGRVPAAPAYRPDRPCPAGCNCVARLLGPERYDLELAAGAFFLLEDWARSWSAWSTATFGGGDRVVGEILRATCRGLVAVRTPASGDFLAEAQDVARRTGLPLRWLDVGLDRLAGTGEDAP